MRIRPFAGEKSKWQSWKRDALTFAKAHRLSSALTRDDPICVDPLDMHEIRRRGITDDEIRAAEDAWLFLAAYVTDEKLKNVIYESNSPSEAWKELCDWGNPQTAGREMNLIEDFFGASLPKGVIPWSCTRSYFLSPPRWLVAFTRMRWSQDSSSIDS